MQGPMRNIRFGEIPHFLTPVSKMLKNKAKTCKNLQKRPFDLSNKRDYAQATCSLPERPHS